MMQQVYQQDAGMQEQVGQQMVLCPVRFVYETQMLMPPGEQMQQQQTILINPQNPPPWIQNRPVQNRVIYVQHMPGNYMPSQPQHIDQNQLYIQNYGYQNVQQMLVPNQEQRPMQMIAPNIMANVQQNMTPNVHANIGPNIQTQRIISNVPIQNQINLAQPVNPTVPMNRQIISNQIVNMNDVVNNVEPQEVVTPNMYRQTPQIVQDPRFPSQTITMVPNNNMQLAPRLQFEPNTNVGQMRPTQPNVTANIPPPYPRAATVTNVQDSKKVTTAVNKGNNYNTINANIRSPVQMLRPIQPRSNQPRTSTNFLPIQPANIQPVMTNANNRKIMPNLIPAVNIEVSSPKNAYNRKRKSESPDEIHKKIPINNQNDNVVIIKQIENIVKMNDVGVNTSPIHKADGRIIINNMQITPINPSNQYVKIKEELAKPVRSMPVIEPQNVVRNSVNVQVTMSPSKSFSSLVEKEKLIRNTVYTQARGRVLNDKAVTEIPKTEVSIPKTEVSIPEVSKTEATCIPNSENTTTEVKSLPNLTQDIKEFSHITENKPTELKLPKVETIYNLPEKPLVENVCNATEKNVCNLTENKKVDSKPTKETKQNNTVSKTAELKLTNLKQEIKQEKTEPTIKSIEKPLELPNKKEDRRKHSKVKKEPKIEEVVTEVKLKSEVKVKEDRDFILTHVLGGFVIQESNVAFPIRKPLKEKTLEINEVKKEDKEKDLKEIKNTSKILDISNLNIEECENMKANSEESSKEKENPFSLLKLSTVKKWTAEELSTHLNKYAWNDTVSVLQEHEIDGESLLLVSKLQLMTIGVNEQHADVIAEFIKK